MCHTFLKKSCKSNSSRWPLITLKGAFSEKKTTKQKVQKHSHLSKAQPMQPVPGHQVLITIWLVVSTPLKNKQSNWIISPGKGENKKSLKPPPSFSFSINFSWFNSTLNSTNSHFPLKVALVYLPTKLGS